MIEHFPPPETNEESPMPQGITVHFPDPKKVTMHFPDPEVMIEHFPPPETPEYSLMPEEKFEEPPIPEVIDETCVVRVIVQCPPLPREIVEHIFTLFLKVTHVMKEDKSYDEKKKKKSHPKKHSKKGKNKERVRLAKEPLVHEEPR